MRTSIKLFAVVSLVAAMVVICITTGCQQQPTGAVTQEQAKAMGNTYLQARDEANMDLLDEIYAADMVAYFPNAPEDLEGLDALKEYYTQSHTAFPDLKMVLDEPMVVGDRVIWVWTFSGTNTGPLGELPPTGKSVEFSGIVISKIDDGKITDEWAYFDVLRMYQQLGFTLVPPMPPEE